MKVLVVLNPVAGGKEKDQFITFMKEEFNRYAVGFEVYMTTGENDVNRIKEQIREYKPSRLLSVGGDGTSSVCSQSIIDQDIALGIIPLGSANGMAMELGINEDPEQVLKDFLMSRHYRNLDLYKVNDKYYGMHIGDIGLNAKIVEGFSKEEGRGMFTYAKHFLRELSQREMTLYSIKADEQILEKEAYMVAFANARKYGTGVVLNWKGNPFDGKIEIVVASEMKIRTLLLAGMTTLDDEMAREAPSDIISCQKAEIKTQNPVEVQVDGEYIGKHSDLKIAVVPGAVKLVLKK